ncbi:MAG: sensor histidine kinase [Phormidesmis sp.]
MPITFMGQSIQLKNHPFRFLLYLEWGLLAVAIVSALETPPARPMGRALKEGAHQGAQHLATGRWQVSPLLAVGAIALFGVMGLYLPLGRWQRLGHTLGQILLILLASANVFNDGRTSPFIYLVLVIRGCLMFGLAGRIAVTGVAFSLFLSGLLLRLRSFSGIGRRLPPPVRHRLQDLVMGFQLNLIVLFGLALLLVVLLINALLTERQSQQRLQQANQKLRRSAEAIEKLAMDQERSRIARDIHDALGHSLTALNIQLESALKLWTKDPNQARQFLAQAKQLGTQSLQEVRHSVAALRQDPLAGRTLAAAIAALLQDVKNSLPPDIGLSVTSDIRLSRPLPANFQAIIYRITQAGLTNSVKHASASKIELHLISSAQTVMLTLEDNGFGFNPQQASTGFGLQSMRDRAEAVGGTFRVTSSINREGTKGTGGTQIYVSLPLPQGSGEPVKADRGER